MRPLAVFARCQDKSIEEQIEGGCRYFDLRVRYDKEDGCFIFAHGLVEYDYYPLNILIGKIATAAKRRNTNMYLRIMLETIKDAPVEQKIMFLELKKALLKAYAADKRMRFRFMYKNPFVIISDGFGKTGFVEVAEWINKWWELLLTPRFFVRKQAEQIAEMEVNKYKGIVAQDFFRTWRRTL